MRIEADRTFSTVAASRLGQPGEAPETCSSNGPGRSARTISLDLELLNCPGGDDHERAGAAPGGPATRPAWLALFKGYIAFYKATVPEDVIETLWQRLMRGDADFHIALVAVDEADAPVGLAHVLFHRSTWSTGWYCYLEDLFVDPARRKRAPAAP